LGDPDDLADSTDLLTMRQAIRRRQPIIQVEALSSTA
jgi:hypothetical protein